MFHVISAAIIGVEAIPVTVETDIAFGLGAFNMVGLPDASVKEARERIRAAIKNSGLPFPRTRMTVNLAPADIKKQGPLYDLPIAIAILVGQGEIARDAIERSVFLGELALDGTVRPVSGVLAASLMTEREKLKVIYVPAANAAEATSVPGLVVFAVRSLTELVEHLKGVKMMEPAQLESAPERVEEVGIDFAHISGQEQAKRGLEIAAAGGHNILLKGPPGTGKTMLARAMPSILPLLARSESLEVTSIASVAGILPNGRGLIRERPFRTPHHSCSAVSLVGGGAWPKPGEVSLAHRGVLFLDELPEFSRHVLEHLRQPLEDGEVTVSRAAASIRFPARFLLVGSMNPCACGYATDPTRQCTCTIHALQTYQKKISGPLLDRFDLVIEVPHQNASKLIDAPAGEPSSEARSRIEAARLIQARRFQGTRSVVNAEITARNMDRWCAIDAPAKKLLETAINSQHLSARGLSRVRKVARTIADLAGAEMISLDHVAEALHYRLSDSA